MMKHPLPTRACLFLIFCLPAVLIAWQLGRPASGRAAGQQVYLPYVNNPCLKPGTPVLPAPEVYSSSSPVNFAAAASDLNRRGLALAHLKIGFHVAVGGNRTGIGDYFQKLDQAGVPFLYKSVNDGGALLEVIQKTSGPHLLVFRRSGFGSDPYGGFNYDVPDYSLSPQEAAARHWERHLKVFPPELKNYKSRIWLETINEIDKNRSEWLAEFALETARLALRDGYNWAAFGWSSGEPERSHWSGPKMVEFLRLVGQNPNRLAIALHEYSYSKSNIRNGYPYLIGRFQQLFQVADQHDIPRPTVLITEWGWEYNQVPEPAQAMQDIAWAARLYAYYPQVKGAALWYLGPGFDPIQDQAQKLIQPVADYGIRNYFGIVGGIGCLDPNIFLTPGDERRPLFENDGMREWVEAQAAAGRRRP